MAANVLKVSKNVKLRPTTIRNRLKQNIQRFRELFIEIGADLYYVNTEKLYIDWGYPNWDDYVESELTLKRRASYYYISIYRRLVIELELSDNEIDLIKKLGWAKAKEIVLHINKKNFKRILSDAEEMPQIEFIAKYKQRKKDKNLGSSKAITRIDKSRGNITFFEVVNGELIPCQTTTSEDSLNGTIRESKIREIIEDYPEIISPDPINIKYVLIGREFPLGGNEEKVKLDLLLLDQQSVPTIIETKLFENPESYRNVIAQILEYAAIISQEVTLDKIISHGDAYWKKHSNGNVGLQDIINQKFENINISDFWDKLRSNLATNRLRLIIVSSDIKSNASKIIKFIDAETKNINILGIAVGRHLGHNGKEKFHKEIIGAYKIYN